MAEITGRKVLVFTVSAFAVIIGVNLLLAYKVPNRPPPIDPTSLTWKANQYEPDVV